MIDPEVVVVPIVLVEPVVVAPVVVPDVVVGSVSVEGVVIVSIVIVEVAGPGGNPVAVSSRLETPPPASASSSVAASATMAPAASATRSSAPRAIQSQTGDSRDQMVVLANRSRGSGTSRRPHSRQYSWSGSCGA